MKDLLISQFDPDRYENDPIAEILEMPADIKARLTGETKQLLAEHGLFKFKLNSYPGKLNKSKTVAYDAENIIYHGQVREEDDRCVKEGKGYLFKNRNLYSGYFANDKFCGPGAYVHHDPEGAYFFFGCWLDDVLDGKGIIHELGGSVYRGSVADSLKDGYGDERWPDNSNYKGDFKRGFKWGHGELSWSDKARYVGDFKEDAFDGFGELWADDGSHYLGSWRQNHMESHGKFTSVDSVVYEGDYLNGKKHGKGVIFWPNGTRWEGTWMHGKKSGEGKYYDEENFQVSSLNTGKKN